MPMVLPVRVHCDAEDCNALLEVSVNLHQTYENPVIVRCGRCRRLLEVDLSQAVSPHCTAAYSIEQASHCPEGRSTLCWAETVSTGFGKRAGSATWSLNRPPVLVPSRDARMLYNSEALCKERDILNLYNIQKPRPLSRFSAQQLSKALKSNEFLEGQRASDSSDIRPTLLASFLKTKNRKCKTHKIKKPSAYNMFMRRELKQIIAANPHLDHRQAFKIAAGNWIRSPTSCTNQKTSVGASETQHQPSPNKDVADEPDAHPENLETQPGQPDTAPHSHIDESQLDTDINSQGNSWSMIDLLTRKNSLSNMTTERRESNTDSPQGFDFPLQIHTQRSCK